MENLGRLPRGTSVRGLEGARIGRYQLEDCLGSGSHTAVYRASEASGDRCAVKLVDARLQGDEDLAGRLRRDAAILDHVRPPQILPILNPIQSSEMTVAAMPLLDAQPLRDLMRGGLDPEQAWTILGQVADSLESAHQWGLTYKVLKPANILVRDGRAYLAEFGITGRYSGQVGLATRDYELPEPQYLAPEQIMGEEPDHRADIYAFAVLVFELATATTLYDGAEPSVVLQRTLREPPPSASERNPRVPPDVDGVLRRALARDPRSRHESVVALIEELACPPQPGGADGRQRPAAAGPEPAPGPVTIDSLIDVLAGVLNPEEPRA